MGHKDTIPAWIVTLYEMIRAHPDQPEAIQEALGFIRAKVTQASADAAKRIVLGIPSACGWDEDTARLIRAEFLR